MDEDAVFAALGELRDDTLRRVEAMRGQVAAITEASELTTHDDEHDPEGATVGFERASAQSLLEAARRDLQSIDHAEQRLRTGTYGTCDHCHAQIAAQRLEALPTAPTCITCASRTRRR